MLMIYHRSFFILILGCMSSLVIAEEQVHTVANPSPDESTISPSSAIETGYLEVRTGYTGDVLGAEIGKITENDDQQLQIIEIILPIDPDVDEVDRVKVLSRSGNPIPQDKAAQIFNDYENNNVGIKLYLPKQKDLVFKLKLIDDPDPLQ